MRRIRRALAEHRAAPVAADLIEHADAIFVMDYLNEARLLGQYPAARGKVFLLGAYGRVGPCLPEFQDGG